MSSRPNSPFKWSARSSPARSPSRATRSDRNASDDMSPRAYHAASSMSGAAAAGPSRYGARTNLQQPTYSTNHSLSRAEHYDVVIEGESAAAILPHLGPLVQDQSGSTDDVATSISLDFGMPRSESASSINAISADQYASDATPNALTTQRFESMLQELVQTERNYVKRIETMYQRYALPLQQLARDRDTAIVPMYEAQRLFGNIGELLGANTALLNDLETFLDTRSRDAPTTGLGEIIYRHISCFSCYNEYFNNFEKAKHIEQTMSKNNRAFRDFTDRTKCSTVGIGNVGLKELLMEPVQRIPRYTLLLDGLVRNLAPSDPARMRLQEAISLASKIASCEVDDKTKRAAVHWSFSRNVEGFPAGLISVHRQLIDCIDVDDFPIDTSGPSAMNGLLSPASTTSSSGAYRAIHCSLFLFDDVIVITKRASASSCGRYLTGLDDLNRLADQMKSYTERSTSAHPKLSSKVELGFRGLIDLADVKASDIGGPDLQLTMVNGPSHVVGDKWASRLVRQYATVDALNGPNATQARSEKQRFLENIWRAQALLKTREHRSEVRNCVVPSSCDPDRVRRVIYWNIFYRKHYFMEASKTLAVLHVDPDLEADKLPFGFETSPPAAIMRVNAFNRESGQCEYTVALRQVGQEDRAEGDEDDVYSLAMTEIATQLYKAAKSALQVMAEFAPPRAVSPATPASSQRGRSLTNGLEQFGRSLFGTPNSLRSNGTGSDLFGVKRSRSKGSSYVSRNASTSTRMTQSTALTSSVGSRDMLRNSNRLDVPGNDGVKHSVDKYRQIGVHNNVDDDNITPTKATYDPVHDEIQASPSPVKRKSIAKMGLSPQRAPSSTSKRALEMSSPNDKPAKRLASQRYSRGQDEGEDQQQQQQQADESIPVSPSPSPTRKPTGPRGTSHSRRSSSVAPLRVKKEENGQKAPMAMMTSREEKIQSVWKDVELIRIDLVAGRESLQTMQLRSGVALEEIENCELQQQRMAETLLRLREKLAVLLTEAVAAVPLPSPRDEEAEEGRLKELRKLQAQVSSLSRKCDLLTSLEKDGRMENTVLHKAFNEELDHMYEDAALGEVEQIGRLRSEVKRAKHQRNEANMENKSLQRELALEKAQGEVYRALLEANGLL